MRATRVRSPDAQIDGTLAVVTGAGGGIGRAIALGLAARGARVVAVDIDIAGARRTAAACDGRAEVADVADSAAVEALAHRVVADHGAPGILVNNAGVGMTGRFLDTGVADWEWIIGVNLLGAVHCCRAFGPAMLDRGHGHVVNVSSGLAYVPSPTESAYVATKAGVLAFSRCLRADWYHAGVGVSVVCPGVIDTGIVSRSTRFLGSRSDPVTKRRLEGVFSRGHPPAVVADAVIDAVVRDRSVVPVGIEARIGWWLRGLVPGAIVDLAARRSLGASPVAGSGGRG